MNQTYSRKRFDVIILKMENFEKCLKLECIKIPMMVVVTDRRSKEEGLMVRVKQINQGLSANYSD